MFDESCIIYKRHRPTCSLSAITNICKITCCELCVNFLTHSMKLMDYNSSFSVHLLLFWCTEKEQIKKLM